MIPEKGVAANNAAGVKRLIFCSGKVYYDLTAARKEAGLEDKIAISRLEQVSQGLTGIQHVVKLTYQTTIFHCRYRTFSFFIIYVDLWSFSTVSHDLFSSSFVNYHGSMSSSASVSWLHITCSGFYRYSLIIPMDYFLFFFLYILLINYDEWQVELSGSLTTSLRTSRSLHKELGLVKGRIIEMTYCIPTEQVMRNYYTV